MRRRSWSRDGKLLLWSQYAALAQNTGFKQCVIVVGRYRDILYTDTDTDTDVGITNTEKYRILTKIPKILNCRYFRPQLAYFHDNYFDCYFSAVVTV